MENSQTKDIAIVGIGCRFPGSDNAEKFFQNLIENRDLVGEIPSDRWDHSGLYAKKTAKNRISSKWGGFISGVDEFDSRFFKILPNEAELMDPQQKLFLTCCWEALEDAGYATRAATAGRPIGVYAGVTWNEFSLYANEYGYLGNTYKGAGSLYWGIPNRVSYFFDFIGPSIAIDTACSSSLVAIHLAVQELHSGGCEMALAGAVNLNLHPAKYLFLSDSNFLSSEGKCRAFGEGGDGYVPSEGVAAIVLKPLSAAQEAGDRIYGLIKATATNHGGKATGYTVPNPHSQGAVVRAALRNANIDPRAISYVECHGTGTDLGDPIEIAGLRMAFEEDTSDQNFCGIGTVKSNIGHCEAAAGMAGLIKILYSMQEGILPATLHAEKTNTKIDFENSPFFLVQNNTAWGDGDDARLAGVSSFGAGGSNSHCIVQSPPTAPLRVNESVSGFYPIPVSSANHERTIAYCKKLMEYLEINIEVNLADISYSLSRRETFRHRVVFVANSCSLLITLLDSLIKNNADQRIYSSSTVSECDHHSSLMDWAKAWVEKTSPFKDAPAPGFKGQLISLPNYAFDRSRSWLHASEPLYQKMGDVVNRVIHPLIDTNISTVMGGCFKKRLYRREYFVSEHWVQGRPVLPGVCLVEMALFCGQCYLESDLLSLKDIWFLDPIAFEHKDALDIQIRLNTSESELRFEIVTSNDGVKHVSGKLQIDSICDHPTKSNIDSIIARCTGSTDSEAIYQKFDRSGIVQTGRFRVLTELHYNSDEAIAKLDIGDLEDNQAGYLAHPVLMDGAVQTAMVHLFMQSADTKTVLPFQIGSIVRYRPLTTTVYVVASLVDIEAKKYNVLLCDTDGNALVEFRNFFLKEYQVKERKLSPLLYKTVFKEAPLPTLEDKQLDDLVIWNLTPRGPSFNPRSTLPDGWRLIEIGYPLDSTCRQSSKNLSSGDPLADWSPNHVLFIDTTIVDDSPDKLENNFVALSQTLFLHLKLLVHRNKLSDVLICISGNSPTTKALTQACAGMIRCLNLECKNIRFRVLESPTSNYLDSILFEQITAEFLTDYPALHVRYQSGNRVVSGLVSSEIPISGKFNDTIKVWIVTGAGGGLGLEVTQHCLLRGDRVVMLGRSALRDDARAMLRSNYPEDNWQYLQADLSNPEQAATAVSAIIDKYEGPFGLIHCAGTISDGMFTSKEWESFEAVLKSKAISILSLLKNLSGKNVTQLLLFSSITSTIGNRGQADYAYANGLLDGIKALADHYLANDLTVCSINWPYWASGGMKIDDDRLPAYIEHFTTKPLPTEIGLDLLDRIPLAGSSNTVVTYHDGMLGHLLSRQKLKDRPAVESKPVSHIPDAKSSAPLTTRSVIGQYPSKKLIQDYLVHLLEQELKLEITSEDLIVDFSDLGVDSIAQMDLITKLEKEKVFSTIPQSLLVDNKNITALVNYFYTNHPFANYSLF